MANSLAGYIALLRHRPPLQGWVGDRCRDRSIHLLATSLDSLATANLIEKLCVAYIRTGLTVQKILKINSRNSRHANLFLQRLGQAHSRLLVQSDFPYLASPAFADLTARVAHVILRKIFGLI